jgi:MarR family transcriptional regulator for hemolysin
MAPSPRVTQLLARAARALTRRGDELLKPTGLRYAQVPVVVFLQQQGPLTQKALADAVGVEQPSMAELLSRMARDGLVVHSPHPTDRRSRTIGLAEDPLGRIDEAARRLAALEDRATAGLTPQEITVLAKLLSRVVENLTADLGV